MNIIKFNLIYTFFEVFMKIFSSLYFRMRHDRNISWEVQVNIFHLYKGIYNFEAVFLMDSRIPKGFVCASVF